MKKLILSTAAALAMICGAQTAQAACAEFQVSAAELSVDYDPFDAGVLDRIFTLRVRRLDPSATSVRLLLIDPDPAGGGAKLGPDGPANYEILWNSDTGRRVFAVGAEQPNATNGALVPFGAGPSGDLATETFRLRVPAGQGVGAGNYYQPLEVRYVCYSGDDALDSPDVQAGAQLGVNLNVPERISTFIGSQGIRRGRIDFGALDVTGSGETRGLMVTAQSTIPYEVDVDTDRGGLKRSDGDNYVLPYSMRFSGVPVSDGSRLSCSRTNAPTGRTHPLQVDINPRQAAQAPAGSYSDVITLTFGPRLGLAGGEGCAVAAS